MTGHAIATSYEPSVDSLRALLPDLAERSASQLLDLYRNPTPERAERLAIELDGVRSLALRLHHALIREGGASGR